MSEAVLDAPLFDKRKSFFLLLFCYAVIVESMGVIGIFVSFLPQIAQDLTISKAQTGLALSLFSVPSALVCMPIGRLVDRIGICLGMIMACLLIGAGDIMMAISGNRAGLYLGMLLTGTGFGCLVVACPSALVSWLKGDVRTRALSFWSTYGPAGYAFGLLLSVFFANGSAWRHAFLCHAVVALCLAILSFLLPRKIVSVEKRPAISSVSLLFRDLSVIRLAAALALPNAVAYGVSVVTPSYLNRVYGMGLGLSNSGIAASKIFAMMLGGVLTGYVLTKNFRFKVMYRIVVCLGALALLVLFFPRGSFALALVGLVVWLLAFGGMAGAATAQLPFYVNRKEDIGIVSGLIGQITSIVCLVTPPIYFALSGWEQYWGLSCIVLCFAALVVPFRLPR
ncbi:MAG: MFS transporter [Acetobacter sp.]|uniref:MFS transporter n=1 Tax=Acetobacter sp. TaxID=440 RepID=UPI0039EA189E